jgi:hypothetical protein
MNSGDVGSVHSISMASKGWLLCNVGHEIMLPLELLRALKLLFLPFLYPHTPVLEEVGT